MANPNLADATAHGSDDDQQIIQAKRRPSTRPITAGEIPDDERAHQKTKATQNKLFNKQRTHARRVALADQYLTGTQKSVVSLMIDRLNPANDWAWQTVRSIAKHLGTGKNVVMETFTRVENWLFLFERRHPQGNEKYNAIAHWRFPKNILDVPPRDKDGQPLKMWDDDFGFAHKRQEGGLKQGTACTSDGGQPVPETGDKGVPQTGDFNDRQSVTIGNEPSDNECNSPACDELFYDGRIKISSSQYNTWRKDFEHWSGGNFKRVLRDIDDWLSDDSSRKIGLAGINRWIRREYDKDASVSAYRQAENSMRDETEDQREERWRKYIIRQENQEPGLWAAPDEIPAEFVQRILEDRRKILADLDWRKALLDFHADTHSWREEWGPSPRGNGCLAPKDLLAEYGFVPAFQRGCISLWLSELNEVKYHFPHVDVEAELAGMEPRIRRLPQHKDQKAAIWAALAKINREAGERKAIIAEKDARDPWSPNYKGDGRI